MKIIKLNRKEVEEEIKECEDNIKFCEIFFCGASIFGFIYLILDMFYYSLFFFALSAIYVYFLTESQKRIDNCIIYYNLKRTIQSKKYCKFCKCKSK